MRPQYSLPALLLLAMLGPINVSAQFGPQQQFFCQGPRSVDVVDADGDGALDLLIAARQGLGLYLNNGQGQFASPVYLGTDETIATTADVNNDGLPDVIASREDNEGLYLYVNGGQASFGTPLPVASNISANELDCADLDNDGDMDLFFVSTTGSLFVCTNSDGTGLFGPPVEVATLTQLSSAQAVDIDGDGDLDLQFSSAVMNEVDACFNDGTGFGNQQQLSVAGHGTVRDIDNDGHPDVLIANTASGMVGWQRNGIDQLAFGAPSVIDPTFNSPEFVCTSDLDGDGDHDAIITSSVLQEVAWFENIDGQGGFGPHQTVTFGIPVTSIATGDVDGDGDEDLFVASSDLNKVIWYTNMTNATGKIMGRVFNDLNGDGIFNGNEHGLVNMRVEASDLGATYTNASGMYWFNAVPAGYSINKPAEDGWAFTTADQYTVNVPVQGASQGNDFGLQADGVINDLAPDMGSAPMRCDQAISYWATVTNTGNQISDVELNIDLDALSTFVSADPAPDYITNGVGTWVFTHVQPTHQRAVHLVVQLPGSDHVGETLHDLLQANTVVNGQVLSTNNLEYMPILVCAIDPNDKQVIPVGEGAEHLTAMGAELFYRIRFQNTGNASALRVVLVDTLDQDLDLSTLRVLNSSHAFYANLLNGVLTFTFDGINLPDSASDPVGSQGYVHFAIHPHQGLAEGTVVNNRADIYFDSNPAVLTNVTLNTLTYGSLTGITEAMTPSSSGIDVYPNPTQGTATVRISDLLVGRIDVNLFDATGGLVRQYSRRSNTLLIERGDLPDGVYFLRATDERGTSLMARLEFAR